MNILPLCTLLQILAVTVPQKTFLQMPARQMVSIGNTIKLHCHTGQLTYDAVLWYKQQLRERLQFVYTVGKHLPPDGRFSGEVNSKSTEYSLVIRNIQRNDSGLYYCSNKKSYLNPLVFGNGSKVLITGRPEIIVLFTPLDEMFSLEFVPLMCLVSNVISDTAVIEWNISTWDAKGWSDFVTMNSATGYSIISHIRVPAEAWKYGTVCTCSVQINSTASLVSEKLLDQREPPLITCLLMFPGAIMAMLVLVVMLTVFMGYRYRNCDLGNWNTNERSEFRSRVAKQETLYAHLAFTEDPIL
ncbi:immunoglobulin kappa light chain-like [Hemiscyllium ocellatum]|uniref:immunoglobulin kappa light chain-like n=1 Tax=Hemiscyllium ocellatum TaxID=170820 RepID=UPI002965FE45|nr:immunoglobulin kappa light chain-like [Hemiscyllium ocellatum]